MAGKTETVELSESTARAMEHFVLLARRGRSSGASGGERRACRLANAILDNVSGLDGSAIKGMLAFALLASAQYYEACELFDSNAKNRKSD